MSVRFSVQSSHPGRMVLIDATSADVVALKSALTYRDRGVEFQISKHKRNTRWMNAQPDGWQERLDELKSQLNKVALFEGPCGAEFSDEMSMWTYAGLADYLRQALSDVAIDFQVSYPTWEGVPWEKVPEHEERRYQVEAAEALWKAKHGAVELPTGSGKSAIIMKMAHDAGLQTLVMAPTRSIAGQLYQDFSRHLGKRLVGMYGDGRKEVGKKFTIGISASLTRVEQGTPAAAFFGRTQIFVADESHMTPATTLEKVCSELVAAAPYRFFFSATQTRTDGSELVLKGITGSMVYTKTFQELVDEGYLAKPYWKMVRVPSSDSFFSEDPLRMTQRHLLYSPGILKKAGVIINEMVRRGQRVLVLVEEIEQFPKLLAYLSVGPAKFAHGASKSDPKIKAVLPEEYRDSNPSALVEAFDRGEFPVLVGTSCISMGTDVKSCKTLVYLQGGTSAISVPQAVGRGTRTFKFLDGRVKDAFNFVDFAPVITNDYVDDADSKGGRMSLPFRHAIARSKLYNKLYPNNMQWM